MKQSKPLTAYKTLVFDCDGVVLDSNAIKTNAFYQAALEYGDEAARTLVSYHTANGGVSRYRKFQYFLENIVPECAAQTCGPNLDKLLSRYASLVLQGLLTCEAAAGLHQLRNLTRASKWLIVSGGDQAELREIFARRKMGDLFDGGIFGSPDTKDVILARELSCANIEHPAIFFGDSKYDHSAAVSAGLDFTFVSSWTEVDDWREWTTALNIYTLANLEQLLD